MYLYVLGSYKYFLYIGQYWTIFVNIFKFVNFILSVI